MQVGIAARVPGRAVAVAFERGVQLLADAIVHQAAHAPPSWSRSQPASAKARASSIDEADHLQAERHAVDRRTAAGSAPGRRAASSATTNAELPVDCRPFGAAPRRRQGDAAVVRRGELGVERADAARARSARRDSRRSVIASLSASRVCMTLLSLPASRSRGAAQEPAHLEAVDLGSTAHARRRWRSRPPRSRHRRARGRRSRCRRSCSRLASSPAIDLARAVGRCAPHPPVSGTPAASASPGRAGRRADEPRRAGVAADARDDLVGDLPGILQRRGDDAGAALALSSRGSLRG